MTPDEKAASQTRQTASSGIAIAALILALLGCALALGLGIGYGRGNSGDIQTLRGGLDQLWSETQSGLDQLQTEIIKLTGNLTSQNATIQELQLNFTIQYQMLQSEIMLLRAQFVDGLMNVSNGGGGGGYTMLHVQNGTVTWQDDYGQIVPSTYSLDVIIFGPLSFQLLTLPGPSVPMIINPASNGVFNFYLSSFTPFVSQLVQNSPPGFFFLPLTSSNAAKINVTGDNGCFVNENAPFPPQPVRKRQRVPFCFERSQGAPYREISRNSLILIAEDFSRPDNYFLSGAIDYPTGLLDGQAFRLTSPWQLVLAAF